MRLDEVISGVPAKAGAGAIEITDLAYDNRAVRPGTLFFCVPGFTRDGHDYAAAAAQAGAAALVVERPVDAGVPEVLVDSVRASMGPAAARFQGDPTARLKVVGVTGTNGKTTTAFLVRELLQADGRQTGLLGTVTSVIGGSERAVERTTPEGIDLQRTFREMLDAGDVACAMEVSSHALALHRTDGIHFAVSIFTNLTQDHLDFHGTMEDYFDAKRRLFSAGRSALAVVNVDDPYGRRLAAELEEPITFALDRDATYRATNVEVGLHGCRFTVRAAATGSETRTDTEIEVSSPLRGRFNVYNVLGSLAAACAAGVPLGTAVAAIETAGRVPGRFEPVEEGQDFAVLVDYAHTPDSLENVLQAARTLTDGHLHVVFGCGGDRDRGKRPLMGAIATRLADHVIVTSDNPRSEDPEAIIDEILTGTGTGTGTGTDTGTGTGTGTGPGTGPGVQAIVDRRAAIAEAIACAERGDVVVIAGKGHEQGQEFAGGRKVPFDDVTVARDVLRSAALPR